MSTATLFLRRLSPAPIIYLTTPLASSVYRLLSTAPPPNPPFSVVDYLIQSCGLPSNQAIRASKLIARLKSQDRPDAVLRFLRQTGISDSDISTAVSRDARILCSSVENNWRPSVVKLLEIGLSIEDISGIISRCPKLFLYKIVPKIDFWMEALGSLENMSVVLKYAPFLLGHNLEKVLVPNLFLLQKQCGLSVCQIVRLIKCAPRLMASRPEAMKINVTRAEELGVRCPSPMFVYAFIVSSLNKRTVDAKLNNLKCLGFSAEEISALVSKLPLVLRISTEMMRCKVEFLLKEVGCDKLHLVSTPYLLTLSLEKRLIPRSLVQKLLKLKGFPVANQKFASIVVLPDKRFVEKFVLPYEPVIPGLHQAYADACAGNVGGIEWFKNISS